MVNYLFEQWDSVTCPAGTGEVTSRVPGNGTGNGWYYVTVGDQEHGPYTADELTPA